MNGTSSKQTAPAVVDRVIHARDKAISSCARVVLAVTTSPAYSLATSLLARSGMVVAAVARKRTEVAMTQLLSQINMPSRSDVLGLSTRLTHIEMTLDDLSAAVDSMRAAPPAIAPANGTRSASRRGTPRTVAAKEA